MSHKTEHVYRHTFDCDVRGCTSRAVVDMGWPGSIHNALPINWSIQESRGREEHRVQTRFLCPAHASSD